MNEALPYIGQMAAAHLSEIQSFAVIMALLSGVLSLVCWLQSRGDEKEEEGQQ